MNRNKLRKKLLCSGAQPTVIFIPRRHLAMSGNIFYCLKRGRGWHRHLAHKGWVAAEYSTVHMTVLLLFS